MNVNFLDVDDWKSIVSCEVSINRNIWAKLMVWTNMDSDRNDQLPSILSAASRFAWSQLTTEIRLKIFRIGQQLGDDRLRHGVYQMLQRRRERGLVKELSVDDWMWIVSHEPIKVHLWRNFLQWKTVQSPYGDDLSNILRKVEDFDWSGFAIMERLGVFKLGRQHGAPKLVSSIVQDLRNDVQLEILEGLSVDDWKYIVANEDIDLKVWGNLGLWIKLDELNEVSFPDILSEAKSFSCFNDYNCVELFLTGKRHGLEKMVDAASRAMSEVIVAANIEQLQVEDWLKITNTVRWCGVLWKNLMSWATGVDEASAKELREKIAWLPMEADFDLMNEEEKAVFQVWRPGPVDPETS
jgi:hypothetical protein